jgi:hypothetical protein
MLDECHILQMSKQVPLDWSPRPNDKDMTYSLNAYKMIQIFSIQNMNFVATGVFKIAFFFVIHTLVEFRCL